MEKYLKILGLKKGFTKTELKSAYKTAVFKNHPDKFQDETQKKDAEIIMKEINSAYEYLKAFCSDNRDKMNMHSNYNDVYDEYDDDADIDDEDNYYDENEEDDEEEEEDDNDDEDSYTDYRYTCNEDYSNHNDSDYDATNNSWEEKPNKGYANSNYNKSSGYGPSSSYGKSQNKSYSDNILRPEGFLSSPIRLVVSVIAIIVFVSTVSLPKEEVQHAHSNKLIAQKEQKASPKKKKTSLHKVKTEKVSESSPESENEYDDSSDYESSDSYASDNSETKAVYNNEYKPNAKISNKESKQVDYGKYVYVPKIYVNQEPQPKANYDNSAKNSTTNNAEEQNNNSVN